MVGWLLRQTRDITKGELKKRPVMGRSALRRYVPRLTRQVRGETEVRQRVNMFRRITQRMCKAVDIDPPHRHMVA